MRQTGQFEYHDEFVKYLQTNGVTATWDDYVWWMTEISTRLGRRIGPSELAAEADDQRILAEVELVDKKATGKALLKNPGSKNNAQSILRKYAKMVRSGYLQSLVKAPVPNDLDAASIPARLE